jgi:hypothetical protein
LIYKVVANKTTNRDIFINIAIPTFAAHAIVGSSPRSTGDPHHDQCAGAALKPARLVNSRSILSAGDPMDVGDPQWNERLASSTSARAIPMNRNPVAHGAIWSRS